MLRRRRRRLAQDPLERVAAKDLAPLLSEGEDTHPYAEDNHVTASVWSNNDALRKRRIYEKPVRREHGLRSSGDSRRLKRWRPT